ncbi:MAG: Flp family type IVb pilin [Proteobacteria bacterium]|nr:Flp family type IVb pilin [Pseudomonadota bacterium]
MTKLFSRFLKDEGGATAIEYGLIAALISVVMVSVLVTLGPEIKATFMDVQTNLQQRNSL